MQSRRPAARRGPPLHRHHRSLLLQPRHAALADGLYDLRGLATDAAGNTATSAAVTNRRIDNTGPTVSVSDPGAYVHATITVSATAADTGSGVASRDDPARADRDRPPGRRSAPPRPRRTRARSTPRPWPAAATTSARSRPTWPATQDVRDARQPRHRQHPADRHHVQTTNVTGGTPAHPETGDTIIYSFSEAMSPASILAGWTGTSTVVRSDSPTATPTRSRSGTPRTTLSSRSARSAQARSTSPPRWPSTARAW